MDAMYTSRSIQLEAPMAMPRSGHQWACIITCPGHHKDDTNDEDDEDDEDDDEDDENGEDDENDENDDCDENGEDWFLSIGSHSKNAHLIYMSR